VLLYDHRANGRSVGAALLSKGAALNTLSEDAATLVSAVGFDRVVVLGHSFGAAVAVAFALQYPERTAGLILCAPALSTAQVVAGLDRARDRLTPPMAQAFARVFAGLVTDDAEYADLWRVVLPLYFSSWPHPAADRFLESTTFRVAPFTEFAQSMATAGDLEQSLRELDTAVLWIDASADWARSPTAAATVAKLAQGEHRLLPNAGHFPFIEANMAFLKIARDWLRRHAV
jgi:pimeloyl-ACP methyl ester carboxylesterase